MMTAVMLRTGLFPEYSRLFYLDCNIRRVGNDVEHSRTLLRLGDKRLDISPRGVGIDIIGYLDTVETVTYIAVDTEDALNIHAAFQGR